MDVAILGGTGKFGRHIGRLLDQDHTVVISGESVNEAKDVASNHGWGYASNTEAVQGKDVVICCVSMEATLDVIHTVGPYIDEETLFCDITSVKQKPCDAMKQYSNQVLGMHPMYGPSNTVSGQNVVLCPIAGTKWKIMKDFWEENDAETFITDPEDHDRAMSIVQGATHFAELVIAETIRQADADHKELDRYASPVYRLSLDLIGRMLNQKPALYHSIQEMNPENQNVRDTFIKSAEKINSIIGNKRSFSKLWDEIGEPLDLKRSQERTDRIIEYMTRMEE